MGFLQGFLWLPALLFRQHPMDLSGLRSLKPIRCLLFNPVEPGDVNFLYIKDSQISAFAPIWHLGTLQLPFAMCSGSFCFKDRDIHRLRTQAEDIADELPRPRVGLGQALAPWMGLDWNPSLPQISCSCACRTPQDSEAGDARALQRLDRHECGIF